MTVDFNDYFWGEKNNGFDVLYHNMKYGLSASKELSEYFRERSNIEENYSKLLIKLANKASSGCVHGTFAPIWVILKSSAERLSTLHLQMVTKITELVKEVTKYSDDLHKKHKSVKEEESGTLEVVQAMQTSTLALQKAKDLYTNRMQEIEKLKKDNSSQKDIEKAEIKLKKQHDDYKTLAEKHNPVKTEFERRMTMTCKRFQEIEETHLKQMREFLTTYVEVLHNNHELVGQVHSEFKRQFIEMSVDKLLEQFVLNKYTGFEKPETIELDLTNWNAAMNQSSTNSINTINTQQQIQQRIDANNAATAIAGTSSQNDSGLTPPAIVPTKKESTTFKSWFSSSSTSSSSATQAGMSSTSTPPNRNDLIAIGGSSSVGGGNSNNSTPSQLHNLTNIDLLNASNSSKLEAAVATSTPTTPVSSLGAANTSSTVASMNTTNNPSSNVEMKTNKSKNAYHGLGDTNNSSSQPAHHPSQTVHTTNTRSNLFENLLSMKNTAPKTNTINDKNNSCQVSSSSTSSPHSQSSVATDTNLREGAATAITYKQQKNNSSSSNSNNASSRRTTTSSFFNLFISNTTQVTGFLRSRRDKAKKKSKKNKNEPAEQPATANKEEKLNDPDDHDDLAKSESSIQPGASLSSPSIAPTASGEVDEDGYSIKPKEAASWENAGSNEKGSFYSSSDTDSEDDREKKIHVKIKPLNNGVAPISASVDELRATVENLSLSPIGMIGGRRGSNSESDSHIKKSQSVSQQIGDQPSNDLLGLTLFQQQHQSPIASNTSTPTATHPYAPLQSPTLSVSNTSTNKYGELGDIFSEFGELGSSSAPPSATLSKVGGRQIPTPTSVSSIAIPRPPSRRSEAAAGRGRVSPVSISRAESVGSLEFRTACAGIGSSRGPSPLTIGMTDTIPLAVAFHEIVHAYFRGSDESRCQVKMTGDMMLSFPAGIVGILANNPNPAKLGFRIKNIQNLDKFSPNKQLVAIDKLQSTSFSTTLEFNMAALTELLRRQSQQNPTASYFNVDILKYQIRTKPGAGSCPLQLVSYWKCSPTQTDIKIDYKYNTHALATPSPLLNVSISVPVDGGVKNVQSKPHSAWLGESSRLVWNFTDISQHSDNHGVDTLKARLEIGNGPSNPAVMTSQFNCEGTTLSGIEFELAGPGYRLSLVKRRFVSGKYICEADTIRNIMTPTPQSSSVGSPNLNNSGQ